MYCQTQQNVKMSMAYCFGLYMTDSSVLSQYTLYSTVHSLKECTVLYCKYSAESAVAVYHTISQSPVFDLTGSISISAAAKCLFDLQVTQVFDLSKQVL